MKVTLVGGTFNDLGGEPSTMMRSLLNGLLKNGLPQTILFNGGSFDSLCSERFEKEITESDVVLWFANVSNDRPKIVKMVKTVNPKCILVTSKRNLDNKYSLADIIQHALRLKSNLIVEFKGTKNKFSARVLDPLGNLFLDFTYDFNRLGETLARRILFLSTLTRMPSKQVGEAIECPDETDFFTFVRESAEIFDSLLPTPTTVERFLGNASFRCQRGFPSFRKDGYIFVSKRNVEKKFIGREGFVAVNPNSLPVEYYGECKPSVDTPIQVKLYQHFPNINYMIHGHVYVRGAPMTQTILPCGSMEEFDEILECLKTNHPPHFCVNLRGHGFIDAWNNFRDGIEEIKSLYMARQMPER